MRTFRKDPHNYESTMGAKAKKALKEKEEAEGGQGKKERKKNEVVNKRLAEQLA